MFTKLLFFILRDFYTNSLVLRLIYPLSPPTMATASDGDPPDPSKANVTNNVQSPVTPADHSAKNDSVSPTNDGETQYFVIVDDDANATDVQVQPPSDPGTGTATHPSSRGANASIPINTDGVSTNYSNTTTTIVRPSIRPATGSANGISADATILPDTEPWDTNPWRLAARKKRPTCNDICRDMMTPDTDIQMTDTTTGTDNTIYNNDNEPNSTDTTPTAWTPIKIGWNSTIPADDSIHEPHITNPVDDNKSSQHPFIAKLSSFISSASKSHNSPIAIKTSRSKCILQPKDLHPY